MPRFSCPACYLPARKTTGGNIQAHWDSAGNTECPGDRLPFDKCLVGVRRKVKP
jgi:hypothetical protein